MSLKIAIVGTHGSGKTTILSYVYSELKKANVRVGLSPEVARSSLFLAAKEKTPKMQMDLFGRQISSEMTYSRNCDILLCDRSLFDIIMYTRIFFKEDAEAETFESSMAAFSRYYAVTYDHIFMTSKFYSPSTVKDEIRPEDKGIQLNANEELSAILKKYDVNHTILGSDTEREILDWVYQKIA